MVVGACPSIANGCSRYMSTSSGLAVISTTALCQSAGQRITLWRHQLKSANTQRGAMRGSQDDTETLYRKVVAESVDTLIPHAPHRHPFAERCAKLRSTFIYGGDMLKKGCEGPCSWFAECQAMCDSKLPCSISLDNVEASLRIAQQLKAEILPLILFAKGKISNGNMCPISACGDLSKVEAILSAV